MADDATTVDTATTTGDVVAKVVDQSPILKGLGKFISHIDAHVLLWDFAGLALLFYMFSLFRTIHRSPKYQNIDLTDLLLNKTTNALDSSKLKLVVASIVLTWAFIYLTLDGKLTEWFTAVYIGAFLTDRITSRIYGDSPLAAKGQTVSMTRTESTVIGEPNDDESNSNTGSTNK